MVVGAQRMLDLEREVVGNLRELQDVLDALGGMREESLRVRTRG